METIKKQGNICFCKVFAAAQVWQGRGPFGRTAQTKKGEKIMEYIQKNKAAWEAAFERRAPGWGDDVAERLAAEHLPFLHPDVVRAAEKMDFSGKSIAQFCCNNGRELLALMQLGAKEGTGFDIAENMVAQACQNAAKANLPCTFVAGDVLQLGKAYHGRFDLVLFTIGAITWFEDVGALFRVAAACLKPGGTLLLHDYHPFMNMLPLPGEEGYDAAARNRIAYPYFRTTPWMDSESGGYMAAPETAGQGGPRTETFTSFSHTTAAILQSLLGAGLALQTYEEYDHDAGLTDAYDGQGYPLSLLVAAQKP